MTSTEITGLISVVTLVVGALIGWFGRAHSAGEQKGSMESWIKNKLETLEGKISNLPCIRDKTYERQMGALEEKVDNLAKAFNDFQREMREHKYSDSGGE